jgi:hypothetical protein
MVGIGGAGGEWTRQTAVRARVRIRQREWYGHAGDNAVHNRCDIRHRRFCSITTMNQSFAPYGAHTRLERDRNHGQRATLQFTPGRRALAR